MEKEHECKEGKMLFGKHKMHHHKVIFAYKPTKRNYMMLGGLKMPKKTRRIL